MRKIQIPAALEKAIKKELDDTVGNLSSAEREVIDEAYRAGIRWMLNRKENRVFFADGVDYQHEIGATSGDIYASKESALEQSPCSKECGVVECLLVPLRWVHPQNLDLKTRASKKKDDNERIKSIDARIQSHLEKIQRLLYWKCSGGFMDKNNDLQMKLLTSPRPKKKSKTSK